MRVVVAIAFSILFFTLLNPIVSVADWKEDQAEADQYYDDGYYGKAFNMYYKLAKMGVSHSQDRVSRMYESGQGKKMNLEEAYAWSVLAAQRGASEMIERRDGLLEKTSNKDKAGKKASKLMSKYGREALQNKADSKARLKHNTKSGGCTGSKLGCR